MTNLFIERSLYGDIFPWFAEPEILAISGPRQSGKTTLLKKIEEDLSEKNQSVVFANFENSSVLEDFQNAPIEFIKFHLQEKKTFFLFDEFQHVEMGGKILKLLFDTFPTAKFIISGSSSLKIKEIASFLVGRVIFFRLYPLSFSEIISYKDKKLFSFWQKYNTEIEKLLKGRSFSLPYSIFQQEFEKIFSDYLIYGGYPRVVISNKEKRVKRLQSLVETYIEKDIIRHLRVGNFLEFKHLARIFSLQIGNIVNYNSLSRETKLNFREIKKFSSILSETFVLDFVSPFFRNKASELKKNPKAYFLDLGLRNTLVSDFRDLTLRPDLGFLVENFVYTQLRQCLPNGKISFWRTKSQAEVDFVLELEGELIPLEVKYREMDRPEIDRSFTNFLNLYQPRRGVILNKNYSGTCKRGNSQIVFLPLYLI